MDKTLKWTLKWTLIIWAIIFCVFLGITVFNNHLIAIRSQSSEHDGTLIDAYRRLPEWDRTRVEAILNPIRYLVSGLLAFGGVKATQAIQRRKAKKAG